MEVSFTYFKGRVQNSSTCFLIQYHLKPFYFYYSTFAGHLSTCRYCTLDRTVKDSNHLESFTEKFPCDPWFVNWWKTQISVNVGFQYKLFPSLSSFTSLGFLVFFPARLHYNCRKYFWCKHNFHWYNYLRQQLHPFVLVYPISDFPFSLHHNYLPWETDRFPHPFNHSATLEHEKLCII